MDTFSKTFVIDLKPIYHILGKELNDFYFYPDDVEGFIESCVLATQRNDSVEARQMSIMNDLKGAMDLWNQREDDHDALLSGIWISGQNYDRYMALKVMGAAVAIDTYVFRAMSVIYEIYDNLSIDAKSFVWTPCHGLIMRVRY